MHLYAQINCIGVKHDEKINSRNMALTLGVVAEMDCNMKITRKKIKHAQIKTGKARRILGLNKLVWAN